MKKSNALDITHIGILGAGAMGTALAAQWSSSNHDVTLWDIRPSIVKEINEQHTNRLYFPHKHLPNALTATSILAQAASLPIVIVAIPSNAMINVLKKARPFICRQAVMINVAKGLDAATGLRMQELYDRVLNIQKNTVTYATVSGPSMAHEIITKAPTAMSLGCMSKKIGCNVSNILSTSTLKFEPSTDVVGIELGGILKNVYAIAAGMCDGMKMGYNTKSWLMTHAYQEMRLWMKVFGAKQETLDGLSGIGDFIVTAMSPKGRNRMLGERICVEGHCRFIKEINFGQTVEGLWSTKTLARYKRRFKLRLPLFELVERVLYRKADPRKQILKYFSTKSI